MTRPGLRDMAVAGALLMIAVVAVFLVLRVSTDAGHIATGTTPPRSDIAYRYAAFPWLAYAHIAPAAVYLLLAPLQLWRGFRVRHYDWHRRIGRVALTAGIVGGLGAVAFGVLMPFSGALEASASAVFGSYLVISLALAYRAIRGRRTQVHRRWMIRAFVIGLGAATIRLWAGLFEGFGVLPFHEGLGVAFWVGFSMHALAAELWLRWRPKVSERVDAPAEAPTEVARPFPA